MPKTALVTGANQGIGFAIVRQLAQKGHLVYLGCRSYEKGTEAIAKLQKEGYNNVKAIELDVVSDTSVAKALKTFQLEHDHLDILVNNAGILAETVATNASNTSLEKIKETYEVNVFGVIRVTQAFLPLIQKSSFPVVLNISSLLGSITYQSNKEGPTYFMQIPGYNSSKTALNAYTVAVASIVSNGKVNAIHPGHVQTNVNGYTGPLTPDQAAEGIVKYGVDLDSSSPSSSFISYDGSILPW